jgi:hypothetical protein
LIPELGRQRQADLCEVEASLVYRASSRIARATQRNPAPPNKQTNKHIRILWCTSVIHSYSKVRETGEPSGSLQAGWPVRVSKAA